MNEIWKPIEGTEGKYEVSNTGKIRNLNYRNQGRIREFQKSINGGGYEFVHIYDKGKTRKMMVHVVVAKAFIPNPEGKPQVNHKDGNKRNNRVENLEWVTQSENMLHAYRTGLSENTRKYARQHMREISHLGVEKRMVPIKATNVETGEVRVYGTIKEACKDLGVLQWDVYNVTSGQKDHAKGYKFERLKGR